MFGLGQWLSLLERRHPREVDLGLERVRAVWERLGSPLPAEHCVVVAGTNGKGSTVAVISTVLESLGFRCGTYTTPHIHAYNERVRYDGRNADDRQFVEAFECIEAARDEVSLSYFEFGTLAAFLILQAQELDFAVMEIGLGGRLDAVNLLDADCAVITPVGLDHQDYLGDDREAIGREKAGIIRRGRPLVLGDRDPPDSVLEVARTLGGISIITKHELVLAIIGGLFVLEAVSVIVQVASCKLTGRRVFRMAPLQHHFEKKGWAEPTIVIRFWIIASVLALAGLSTLKLR